MSLDNILSANKACYTGQANGRYVSTRLVTHNGITIGIALRKAEGGSLFFDYSILNAEEESPSNTNTDAVQNKQKNATATEKLDSETWLEHVEPLHFSSEVRVVGQEVVPVYEIPSVDCAGQKTEPDRVEALDTWLSSSLCLMDKEILEFEALSDGRYIYIFRQGLPSSTKYPNKFMEDIGQPPVDANLLCDRFTLIGKKLSLPLDARYQRSRQKRVPDDENDTLAVKDMNGNAFYEPTFSLRFVRNLVGGRFSVVRAPTAVSDRLTWMFFACSSQSGQIECITTDVASDGLFDLHGQVYYTCNSTKHDNGTVFVSSPGPCSSTRSDTGRVCNLARVPIVPESTAPNNALRSSAFVSLYLKQPIDLTAVTFAGGFTLEGWFNPEPFWEDKSAALPPSGSLFCLFTQGALGSPSVFLDDQLRLVLLGQDNRALATTKGSMKPGEWNHIAIMYSGLSSRVYTLVVNGGVEESTTCTLPSDTTPGKLCGFGYQSSAQDSHFIGFMDEVRLWSCQLCPAMIQPKMKTRASGMELFLEACWHMDEGVGYTAFDDTPGGNHLSINPKDGQFNSLPPWIATGAPITGGYGMSRRMLRLAEDMECRGGISATIYYEQVAVSPEGFDQKKQSDSEQRTKHMKRSARVLLCFVASAKSSSGPTNLAILDIGLLSYGTLSDTPSTLSLPPLKVSSSGSGQYTSPPKASAALLYLGAQGMELFGGLLAFDESQCAVEAPHVFESATGNVIIFFKDAKDKFSALNYDISRNIVASSAAALTGHGGLFAISRLRQVKNISVRTLPCQWVPENVAVDLNITASTTDGQEIIELWRGLPSRTAEFCQILQGGYAIDGGLLGKVADLESPSTTGAKYSAIILLQDVLKRAVTAGRCLGVGFRRYLVVEDANAGDISLQVSMYKDKSAKEREPGPGTLVILMKYDCDNLVTCKGKPASNFTQGSGIIGLSQSEELNYGLIRANATSLIGGSTSNPFITSPLVSKALQLGSGVVYSMLEKAVTTKPADGLTFETWLKVNHSTSNRVVVAYTSERSPRSQAAGKENQTLVVGVTGSPSGTMGFDLLINVNGSFIAINSHPVLKFNHWMHLGCSVRNTFALQFSGNNYVDFGTAAEWNVSDFTLVFSLQLNSLGPNDQTLFAKSDGTNSNTPLHLIVTAGGQLRLCYAAENETDGKSAERSFVSNTSFSTNCSYKVFVSRKLVRVNKPNHAPRLYQLVTMQAWSSDGAHQINMAPESMTILEAYEKDSSKERTTGAQQTHGPVQVNEAPLYVGGAPWVSGKGLRGTIGAIHICSAATSLPGSPSELSPSAAKSVIGSWSFRNASGPTLIDDLGRNHGRLKERPQWVLSPYEPDHQLSVYINGNMAKTDSTSWNQSLFLKDSSPVGPHQLTLGNVLQGQGDTRFLAHEQDFGGELDELRIWNVPRTRENICDSMHTKLSDVSGDIAVYLPFDDGLSSDSTTPTNILNHLLLDASDNCWHLTPLNGAQASFKVSGAPVAMDSPCVRHSLSTTLADIGELISSRPSVSEYGDMQLSAKGGMEGSFKRAYSYISPGGHWCLVTGFRIGSLRTEWVSQLQTSPTLIGYIEGAPPIPVDSFTDPSHRPSTSISFINASRCTYTYSSRSETIHDIDLSASQGLGAKWSVSAGIGVETETSSGLIKGERKVVINVSKGQIENAVRTSTTNVNMETSLELTGTWRTDQDGVERYEPNNVGKALVESEVADLFALRLKTRGPIEPLVAYQLRPRTDIPRQSNMLTFKINPSYTKQGCLDGRLGTTSDPDYPSAAESPKDASYYKPADAYALREQIRRSEEQRQGEYDRQSLLWYRVGESLPQRTKRSICNSYVWTATGGTMEKTTSKLDLLQSEVGGTMNSRLGVGLSVDMDVSLANVLLTANVDAMYSARYNFVMTKEKTSDEGFELKVGMPPSVDIRQVDPTTKKLVNRPGAVDSYRWMSFWLEPSVEATDVFFKKVIDPQWLEESAESDAVSLRSLRQSFDKSEGNARTKAWRVLHRCTYVSRVPQPIVGAQVALANTTELKNPKRCTLLADVACNWLLLQQLEPWARSVKSRGDLATVVKSQVQTLYPTLLTRPGLYRQVLDLISDYVGLQ
ncbi:hypothetical protein FOVSG1_010103 [Fusarium oxysporum f. sp. vasinfectum]